MFKKEKELKSLQTTGDITQLIHAKSIKELNNAISEYLSITKRDVWLLFDNLDKGWPIHGVQQEDILLLRALLEATRKLQRQFETREIDLFSVVFVVQTFDPYKHFGANSARFFNYINLCLGNKLRTIYTKRMKNPLCRPGNSSLSTHWDEADRDQVGDEFCHAHSAYLRKRCERQERQRDDRHRIGEFVAFVQSEDSGVIPVIESMLATGNLDNAALSETGNADFCAKRSRLRQLGRCFLKSEPVPKQRRPYRRRLKRTAPSTPLRSSAS